MSAVAEINLLCGWESLLEPVISWTITYCFCLIKGLTWPRRGTTDFHPTPSCADEMNENKCHICNWGRVWLLTVLEALWQEARYWDSVIPGITTQASEQMERWLGQHANPFFYSCQVWSQQQPLKIEIYSAYNGSTYKQPCSALPGSNDKETRELGNL